MECKDCVPLERSLELSQELITNKVQATIHVVKILRAREFDGYGSPHAGEIWLSCTLPWQAKERVTFQ